MAPTTRKRAQAVNNPQPVTDAADTATGDVTDRENKDDDLFDRVFGTLGDVPSDDHDSDHSDYGTGKKKRKRKSDSDRNGKSKRRFTRRRAPPAPALPDLSDDEYALNGNETEEEEDGGLWSVTRGAGTKTTNEAKIELAQVLSVEVTGEGGVKTLLNLNLADLLKNLGVTSWTLPAKPRSEAPAIAAESSQDTTMAQNKLGFLDLPFELRVKTYRMLFRDEQAIEFDRREFSRSSHFLRTCKTVLREGREVLYGENSFHFSRETAIRGRYYEKDWKEVGYKDVRRFFETIGPASISHMKYISFVLTDGADNRTRNASQIPERKFINDPHLHEIFRLIGANTKLRKLAIQFAGRACVSGNDYNFFKALTEIKCYSFVTIYRYRGLQNKSLVDLKEKMKKVMRVTDEHGNKIDRVDSKNRVKMVYETWFPLYPVMLHYATDW